jgi:hypothetical protein
MKFEASRGMTHSTRFWYILTGSLKSNKYLEIPKKCNEIVKNEIKHLKGVILHVLVHQLTI